MPLNDKQLRFCEEYVIALNASQSALKAGYSPRTAYQQGHALLKKPEIQAHIQEIKNKRSMRTQITQDRVLEELGRLGFSNMLDYIRVSEDGTARVDLRALDRDKAAAVTEVQTEEVWEGTGEEATKVRKIKFKLADKARPLEMIMRHLGMDAPKKVELTGAEGGPIAVTGIPIEVLRGIVDQQD